MSTSTSGYSSYELLKILLKNETFTLDCLNKLKETFKQRIDSNRRSSSVHTIEDLIDILERRDILSHQNIDALQEIAQYSASPTFHDYLQKYIPMPVLDPTINQYHEMRLKDELETKLRIGHANTCSINSNGFPMHSANYAGQSMSSLPVTAIPDGKKETIYKILSQGLGKFWRSFGRELHISEGQMDEIENKHHGDISTGVYKLLYKFENDKRNDPKQHLRLIRDALDNCRRKDLRRDIDDILSY